MVRETFPFTLNILFTSIAVASIILVVGGLDTSNYLLSEVEYLHMTPEGITVQPAPSLPCKLADSAIVTDPDGSTVYVVGGDAYWPDGTFTSNQVLKFDSNIEVWSHLPRLLTGRKHHSAAVLGTHIYVIGGKDLSSTHLSSVEHLNLQDILSGWQHSDPDFPYDIYYHASCVTDSLLWVSGGWPSTQKSLYRLNPEDNIWRKMADMRYDNYGHAMTGVTDATNKIFIYVVGWTHTEVYDPDTNTWTQLTSLPFSRGYIGFSLMPSLGQLVVPGGYGKAEGDPSQTARDTIYVYDIASDSWTLSEVKLTQAKYGAAVARISKNQLNN